MLGLHVGSLLAISWHIRNCLRERSASDCAGVNVPRKKPSSAASTMAASMSRTTVSSGRDMPFMM